MPIRTPPNLPVKHNIPDDLRMTYSNYTYVQSLGGDIVISFFQAMQPIAVTEEEAKKTKSVPATCVARVAMNALQANQLMFVLQEILKDMVQQASEA